MNRITLPANPFDVLLDKSQELSTEQAAWMGSSGARTYAQAHENFQRARRCVQDAKSRMKNRHDGKGDSDQLYRIGDLGFRHDSRCHKLVPSSGDPLKSLMLWVAMQCISTCQRTCVMFILLFLSH
jgi:hypothetical protein